MKKNCNCVPWVILISCTCALLLFAYGHHLGWMAGYMEGLSDGMVPVR